VEYAEYAPPPALGRYVQCLWRIRAPAGDTAPQRILPDGSVELVLHFGDDFRRHAPDGRIGVQPQALVVGITDRPLIIEATGRVDLVGVRFRPGVAGGVLGIPQAALAGSCHDLRDLGVRPLRGLLEAVGNAGSDRGRLGCMEAGLLEASRQATPPAATVHLAARWIVGHAGRAPIGGLVHQTGQSQRHLERQFRREVGLTPKGLARIRRFQSLVARLAGVDAPRWATLAIECGYTDQAHLTREFREFAGTTPAAYWRETHPFSDLFHGAVEFLQEGAAPAP
jgi:AraC-like DNA-binding protein